MRLLVPVKDGGDIVLNPQPHELERAEHRVAKPNMDSKCVTKTPPSKGGNDG